MEAEGVERDLVQNPTAAPKTENRQSPKQVKHAIFNVLGCRETMSDLIMSSTLRFFLLLNFKYNRYKGKKGLL